MGAHFLRFFFFLTQRVILISKTPHLVKRFILIFYTRLGEKNCSKTISTTTKRLDQVSSSTGFHKCGYVKVRIYGKCLSNSIDKKENSI